VVDWAATPAEVDPARGGGLGRAGGDGSAEPARVPRKRAQVESFIAVLREILPGPPALEEGAGGAGERLAIVDFGCGGGNLTLPLAWAFPHCDVVGVDFNPQSVDILRQRAAAARCCAPALRMASLIPLFPTEPRIS
jgi:tRNA G46 methylase TrmB